MVQKTRFSLKALSVFLTCLMIIMAFPISARADVPIVATLEHTSGGSTTTTEYTAIQDALDASSDGDTVHIMAGTYIGQYLITKSITLKGAGVNQTVIQSPSAAVLENSLQDMLTNNGRHRVPILELRTAVAGGNVTVKDLTIDGNHQGFVNDTQGLDREFIGIAAFDTNAVIDNVTVRDIAPDTTVAATSTWRFKNYGILAEGSTALSSRVTVTVQNSTISDFQEVGIQAWGPKLHAVITNNTITGVLIDSDSSTTWSTLAQRGIQIAAPNSLNLYNDFATISGTTAVITGNTISNIGTAGPYTASMINTGSAGTVEISGNTLTGSSNPTIYRAAGMCFALQDKAVNAHDNSLSSLYRGIKVSGYCSAADNGIHGEEIAYGSHTFANNTMTGTEYALFDTTTGNDDENNETITLASTSTVGNSKGYQEYLLYGGSDSFTDTGLAPTKVDGGSGDDTISTGSGSDTLIGGTGNDTLTGGSGNDVFQYDATIDNGADRITDFGVGDAIQLADGSFTGGTVTTGDGTSVSANSVQLSYSGGVTTLYMVKDGTASSSDLIINLTGSYAPADFVLSGEYITYAHSTLNTTTATFDKNTSNTSAGHYTDVAASLTLGNNTLTDITLNNVSIGAGNYTVDANGNVTIKKEYLSTLSAGVSNLIFKFSAGSDRALAITVSNSTPSGGGGSSTPSRTITVTDTSSSLFSGSNGPIKAEANMNNAFSNSVEVKVTDTTKSGSEFGLGAGGTVYPFDISLYVKGTSTKTKPSNGYAVTISLPVPDKLLDVKDQLSIVHRSDDGTVTMLASQLKQISGVWYLVFEATEFSPYALVVKNIGTYDEARGLPYYVDSNGNTVFIGFSANGKYFAPSGVTVLFKANARSFTDTASHWAKGNIGFVTERELFTGTGKNLFSPDAGMTRAMFATVIGRLYERSYGAIAASRDHAFTDCNYDAYYGNYVDWAAKEGIISGYGNSAFGPNDQITREQMAAILYRFADFVGVLPNNTNTTLRYSDAGSISDWAKNAALYCQRTSIITGRDGGSFVPRGTATRAEVAVILERFIKNVVI